MASPLTTMDEASNLVADLNSDMDLLQRDLASDLSASDVKAGIQLLWGRIKAKFDDLKEKIKAKMDWNMYSDNLSLRPKNVK